MYKVLPLTKLFPDWKDMKPGEWSNGGIKVPYKEIPGRQRAIEILLYREPEENEEYAGTYTLQVYEGSDVIFCETVRMNEEEE